MLTGFNEISLYIGKIPLVELFRPDLFSLLIFIKVEGVDPTGRGKGRTG